jgi:ketosteroid isomerase-like protein
MKQLIPLSALTLAGAFLLSMPKASAGNDEAEIRQLLNGWAKAFRAHDVKAIMSMYAPEVVAYDIVPPLRYIGNNAYQKDYEEFLAQYEGPIEVEYRDLKIVVGGDAAFAYGLERFTGTLKNGQKSELWISLYQRFS